MISLAELNPKNVALTPEMQKNQAVLCFRMNKVRLAWGKPMIVTSGVRSLEDHKRIYRELAAKKGVEVIRIPMGSRHLTGEAVDISDPDGELMRWCQANETLLSQLGLWLEKPDSEKRVHFQCAPYGSYQVGKTIFFKP